MDALGIAISVGELTVISAALVAWYFWLRKRAKKTNSWPVIEATIESGEMEVVGGSRYSKISLPAFAFSYQVDGEHYSGRFALEPYITDPGTGIINRMIGQKLKVHYDPKHPEVWFLTDDLIEGCRIEQKLSPHMVNHYSS